MTDKEKKAIENDILFQIDMKLYDEFNNKFCEINEYLGEIYSYKDLEDLEKFEKDTEIKLLRQAVQNQQKEIKKLKKHNDELLKKLKNRIKEVKKLQKYSLYKKEFSILNKQIENLKEIEEAHKEENGELRKENDIQKEINSHLKFLYNDCCKCLVDSIPKSKIEEKIEELEDCLDLCINDGKVSRYKIRALAEEIKDFKELLESEK